MDILQIIYPLSHDHPWTLYWPQPPRSHWMPPKAEKVLSDKYLKKSLRVSLIVPFQRRWLLFSLKMFDASKHSIYLDTGQEYISTYILSALLNSFKLFLSLIGQSNSMNSTLDFYPYQTECNRMYQSKRLPKNLPYQYYILPQNLLFLACTNLLMLCRLLLFGWVNRIWVY